MEQGNNPADDLEWSLRSVEKQEVGKRFLQTMSQFIPVYSQMVNQVYGAYDVNFAPSSVVILPKQYCFDQTFSNIPTKAIRKTGILLIPDNKTLGFLVPFASKYRMTPYRFGKRIIEKQSRDGFLPIIQKGDLREYQASKPVLHIHLIEPSQIDSISALEQNSIKRLVNQKIESLESRIKI